MELIRLHQRYHPKVLLIGAVFFDTRVFRYYNLHPLMCRVLRTDTVRPIYGKDLYILRGPKVQG